VQQAPEQHAVTEAIVLAGGLGTRLRSVVPGLPKVLAPIAGRPFLCYLLDYLAQQGLRRVVLSVGYRCQDIVDAFGDRYGDITIDYAIEQEPLGTGGAIAAALDMIEGPGAFALNGDTFLHLDYQAMARACAEEAPGTMVMALYEVPDTARYGRVMVNKNRVDGFSSGVRGTGLINAGVYLIPRGLSEQFPPKARFSFEKEFLEARVNEIRPLAFVCDGVFIDIGVPEAYREAQRLLPGLTKGL